MGVYLTIKKGGIKTCLSNSHNYKIDGVFPENDCDVWEKINEVVDNAKTRLCSYAAYSPGDLKELKVIIEEVNDEIEYLKDEILHCGRADVISELKEEGFEIIEE